LSADTIATAALDLVDAEGLDALTMRNLAAEVGVDVAVLYRHFRNKSELIGAVIDCVLAEVEPAPGSGDWMERVRSLARRTRQAVVAHPELALAFATANPIQPNRIALIEENLGALRDAGFSAEEAGQAHETIITFVLGTIVAESLLRSMLADDPERRAADARLALESVPFTKYPNTINYAAHYLQQGPEQQFEYGLDVLLTGLASRLG
jgi:AcrR family transcriptional regulator